jgi:hypothetical protein
MKKLITLTLVILMPWFAHSQSCAETCDKKSCGPEGTKKSEAAIITTMRNDLQTVITKMANSPLQFDQQIRRMTIQAGSTDDESLWFLSQAAATIRFELLNKIESTKMMASLKNFKPVTVTTKQQMVANLKKEIQVLSSQAEKL